jgi:peptidoglycan L-alanyl-D-glutamate endopeptidase CwlK
MINSRKITDLHPKVAVMALQFLDGCKAAGIDVIITSTYRDIESQNALYAQGRTTAGKIVTNARGGYSRHNFKCAFDFVPMRYGKPVWGTRGDGIDDNPADDEKDDLELWQRCGAIGKQCGLEWAGDWKSFKEYAHLQYTGGLTLADLRAGKALA